MKKIISTILILTMLLSTAVMLTAFPVSAEEAAPASQSAAVELPNYDSSWTAINSISDLAGIQNNKKYYLNTDLTITDSWTAVANKTGVTIDGRDPSGKVHKIIFGSENGSVTTNKSVFGYATSPTVQNVNLVGYMSFDGIWRTSPLADNSFVNPKLININSSVNLTYTGPDTSAEPLAGIVCWVSNQGSTVIENCVYSGTIRCENYVKGVGGIIGILSSANSTGKTDYIKNCVNKGTFSFGSGYMTSTSGKSVGGIIANAWSNATNIGNVIIEGCVNEGKNVFDDVASLGTSNNIHYAGIVGRINPRSGKYTLKDCVNKESVSTKGGCNWAGIVGLIERNHQAYKAATETEPEVPFIESTLEVVIDGCKNEGSFTFTKWLDNAGGILAKSYVIKKLTIQNCENNGDITVKNGAVVVNHDGIGGIAGKIEQDPGDDTGHSYTNPGEATPERDAIINNCVNNGAITVENGVVDTHSTLCYHVGGILGRAHWIESLKINRCMNNGLVWVECRQSAYNSTGDYWKCGSRWQGSGGIVGSFITSAGSSYLEIANSHNKGEVLGKYGGGILGATFQIYNDDNVVIRIKYCSNSGRITGIIDGTWDGGRPNWGDSSITPTLSATNYYGGSPGDAGGIIGGMDQGGGAGGILYVDYCVNEGEIRGGRFAGGILAVRTPLGSAPTGGDPKNSYISNCLNTGTIRSKSGSYYYAAAGIVGSAKGKFDIKNSVNHGDLVAVHDGNSGYSEAPIANFQEDSWGSTYSGNFYSATGIGGYAANSSGSNYEKYCRHGYVTGGVVGGTGNTDGDIVGKVTPLEDACFKGTQVSYEEPIASQTILITDPRQFAQYDLGARDFVLGSDITTEKGTNREKDFLDAFNGATLDGQGYTVTMTDAWRLFRIVGSGSVVRNINFDGTVSYGAEGGPLANIAGGTAILENITSSVTINNYDDEVAHMGIGGIVGRFGINGEPSNAVIRNCTFSGTITMSEGNTYREKCTGGIVGHVLVGTATDVLTIENCTNTGTINGTRVGGITCGVCTVGIQNNTAFQNAKVNITNCTNTGKITAYAMAAGIATDLTDRSYLCKENTNGAERDALKIPMAEVTIDGCLNTGDVTAYGKPASYKNNGHTVYAGGLVAIADGNVTIRNSINTATVDTQTSDGKGSSRSTGGILGGKMHQSYLETDGGEGITIENCKNTGKVVSNASGIGGIVGYVFVGKITVKSCVNTGHVLSASLAKESVGYIAGGIVGITNTWGDGNGTYYEGGKIQKPYADEQYPINIENCINAGLVEIKIAPERDADAWKVACGIVGGTQTGIKITGCLHTGKLEDNAPWYNSTFPITDPLEGIWGFPDERPNNAVDKGGLGLTTGWNDVSKLPSNWIPVKKPTAVCVYSDNYYTAGSVDDVLTISTIQASPTNPDYHITHHYGQDMYQMSSLATDEQVKMTIQRADVYAFDRVSYLKEQVDFAEWIYHDDEVSGNNPDGFVEDDDNVKYRGLQFSDEELVTLGSEIDKGNALMLKTDENDLWGRQNTVYAQEQAIRDAVNASHTDSSYVVVIPEKIPTNAEVKVSVSITSFSYYDGVKISMESGNNFKLKINPDDTDDKAIPYTMWYEGEAEYLMFSDPLRTFAELESLIKENKALVYSTEMTRSMIAKVDNEANKEKPFGIYKDSVTFKIEKINVENQ